MGGQDRAETSRRSRRSEPALVFALAIASCTTGPLPRLPQVEQATEAVQGGGERYRAHRAWGVGRAPSTTSSAACRTRVGTSWYADPATSKPTAGRHVTAARSNAFPLNASCAPPRRAGK